MPMTLSQNNPVRFLTFLNNTVVKCLISSMILTLNASYAQKQSKFDSIFYNTAVNVSGKDNGKALLIADSLFRHTIDGTDKVRALMLSADINTKKGDRNSAIKYALKANAIAVELGNHEWVARISGFLSTQYRSMGLKLSGLKFLSEGLEASKKIENPSLSRQFQAIALQERAYYQMEDTQYHQAITSLEAADTLFHTLRDSQSKFFFLATNQELLGKNHISASRYDVAETDYMKGLAYLEKASGGDSPLKGFIYDGLGKICMRNKKLNDAKNYFFQALSIAEKADFVALKLDVYKDLSAYYERTGDMGSHMRYNKLYDQTAASQLIEDQKSADTIVISVKEEAKGSEHKSRVYAYVGAAALLILIASFLVYGARKKKEKKKFQKIIKQLRERRAQANEPVADTALPLLPPDKKDASMMSPEVEQLLIERLAKFESGSKFTDSTISLASVSALLDTNSKYLSYIINNRKGKDFNSYINELRVFFIVNKIENDAAYANYKISYLAEVAGFSSHSKFSAVFKSVLGLSPSIFLEQHKASKKHKHSE